jgi:hypothetical protein
MEISMKRRLGGLVAAAVLTGASLVATAAGASAQPTTVSPAASARPLSAGVPFEFVNRGTIRCATVGNASLEDNAPVWESSCVDDPSQNWVADSVGGGFFHFRNLNSGLCLDFARNTNGTTLKQHICGGDVFERWQVKAAPQAPGYSTIVSAAGRCMDLDGGSPATGTKIQIWDCLNNNNQLWLLITG